MTDKTITVPSELIHRAIDAIEQVGYQDKFIDYTFVRAVKQELRDALDEPTRGIDHETMRARYTDPEALDLSSGTGSTLRVVAADPVPPAGGEVEAPKRLPVRMPEGRSLPDGYAKAWNDACTAWEAHVAKVMQPGLEAWQKGREGMRAERDAQIEHVARLQAEVERLKAEHRTENQALRSNFARHSLYLQIAEQLLEDPAYERSGMDWDYEHPVHDGIVALQSELTRARELIGDLRAHTQSGYLKAVQALHNWANQTAPRGYSNIVMTGTSCNQSAPADTCCGSCPAGCVVQSADKGPTEISK